VSTTPAASLDALLGLAVARGATDLHLTAGLGPALRIDGVIEQLRSPVLEAQDLMGFLEAITSPAQREEYRAARTLDLGYGACNGERFRINVYQESGHPAIAARHLDRRRLSFEALRLPPVVRGLARLREGLVLVTGPTGSGKSTTLAALVDAINRERRCHILTIEDPVEFVHRSRQSLVHQRELHSDFASFAGAVRAALREDPDVILIGEMRDLDTVRAALAAAETGHLVLSTLHTGEAIGCVERLLGSFPGDEQAVARQRISMALRAVVAQQLIARGNGAGRVLAAEVLIVNPAVANLIKSGSTRQILSVMQGAADQGMQTMTGALSVLVSAGLLSRTQALGYCDDPRALDATLAATAGRAR